MDSGLGSDEDRRTRTKEQKQRHNQQLLSGCFIDAASLADEGEDANHKRTDERRQGSLIFQSSIPQFSMLQMSTEEHHLYPSVSSSCAAIPTLDSEPATPYNSIVQIEDEKVDIVPKTPLGFYVDLNNVEEAPSPPPSTSSKKNIFSMVIDFEAPKKDMPSRLSSSLTAHRKVKTEKINKPEKNKSTLATSSVSGSNSSCNGNYSSSSRRKLSNNSQENSNGLRKLSSSSDSSAHNPETILNTSDMKVADQCDKETSSKTSIPQEETKDMNLNCSERKINGCMSTEIVENVEDEKNLPQKEDNATSNNTQQFVKLSDLERQAPKVEFSLAPKMSRSIPESSWVESPLLMSRSAGYRSAPHPMEPETSELSDSFTDTCTSQPRRSAQRLGTDLLRMFLEEIGPDVTVEVDGHRLKAHKCILASRCQYFAAILSGNWLEAAGNVISLQGFTYESVYFALCHIYSGAAHVPDSISLVELASLADMLGLEGLKEVVEHALKQRHCHGFHRPCAGCCTGVVEVLPLAATYGLDDLYQKCLQWITQYFAKVWPSRAFASLPKELRDKCYQQHIVHMAPSTVLETTISCDRLLRSIPSLRWAEPVIQLALQLADACQLYMCQHFAAILSSPVFLALESGVNWNLNQAEECLLSTADNLGPDQACRSYGKCHRMLDQIWSPRFAQLLTKLKSRIEQCLIKQPEKLVKCVGWSRLDPQLRAHLRELGGLQVDEPPTTRLPRATNTRLKKYNPTRPTKQQTTVSSSDSSRNSSPGMNQVQLRMSASTGSPSLRRSLLLAARAPQVPASPSAHRRSTLTQPTQSSAAKSAPSRNLKPATNITKPPATKPVAPVRNSPASARTAAQNASKTTTMKDAATPRQVSKKNIATKPAVITVSRNSNVGDKKPISRSNSPRLPNKVSKDKQEVSGQAATSKKAEKKGEGNNPKPAAIQRSDTFLKEEPTVLQKI